jgi:hypothetical protein
MRQLHYLYTTKGFFPEANGILLFKFIFIHTIIDLTFRLIFKAASLYAYRFMTTTFFQDCKNVFFVVSICIFWWLFVSHFFHIFYHIFRLSNCKDKAFYNWILSNNGSVHNFYFRNVYLKLWIDLSIIILFKAVKFQDDTLAQDIIFLTADWSNFDLLNTAIIPVKIFVFVFWTILWHLFDRCLI